MTDKEILMFYANTQGDWNDDKIVNVITSAPLKLKGPQDSIELYPDGFGGVTTYPPPIIVKRTLKDLLEDNEFMEPLRKRYALTFPTHPSEIYIAE